MTIEPFAEKHVVDAATLVIRGYRAERAAVPALPGEEGLFAAIRREVVQLAAGASGVAAVEDGKLVGFLAGWPVEELFGSHPGVYVPLAAHGAAGDRRLIYRQLYTAAAERWVAQGRLTHAITLFAHDAEAVDGWFWNGFGLRCLDSIRDLSAIPAVDAPGIEARAAASPEDVAALEPLHREHHRYYRQSPLFMPAAGPEGSLADWLAGGEDRHVWLALREGRPVAYLMLRHGGETFVSDSPDMRNLRGAYTAPEARGCGAGTLLLAAVVRWMRERGHRRLGVDFESFNPLGSRFWIRHFTPFTYSLVRAIDDRIIR